MLSLARIIDRATTLVLTLVLAAKLGTSGLGTYSVALAFYGVIATAGEAGATLFLVRELATDKSRTASYIVHLSALALAVSFLLTLAGEALIGHVGYSAQVQGAVSLVLLAIFPKTLNSIQEATFIVYGRTEFETITTLVSSVIYLVISLLLLTHGYGVESIVAAYVVLEYLDTIVYYLLITRSIARLRWEFQWALARRLLVEIKAFTGSSALGALFARPEIIMLSLLSTTREVGYYSAAVRVSELWLLVPAVFLDNVYPHLARAHSAGNKRFGEIQARVIKYSLAYALPLSAGMLALAKPIIDTLFGQGFGPSVVALQLLALNVTLYTLMALFWRSVSARGRQDAVLRVQFLIILMRLSIGTALIVPLASLGAAISTTLHAGLQAGMLERVVRSTGAASRIIGVSWRLGVAAATMGTASWLLSAWLSIWIVVPLAAAIYIVALFALRAFSVEEVRTLRAVLPARGGTSTESRSV